MERAQWLALGIISAARVIFLPMWLVAVLQAVLEHRQVMHKQAQEEEVL